MTFKESFKDFCAFCGRDVAAKALKLEHEGKTLIFCCERCLESFLHKQR